MTAVPKFLVVRFAPGAAGNFLASILQCSPEVAHWSTIQQSKKPDNIWIDYFHQVFTSDIKRWLYHEPVGQLRWGTREIFSAKYERGNTLSVHEFLELEKRHCNTYYHQQKQAGRYLPIFWHKEFMPEYFQNSRSLIIKIDNRESLRWFDRAVYFKHHEVMHSAGRAVRVRLNENRPEIVPKNFQDEVAFEQEWPSFREFVKERIFQNPYRSIYQCPENMKPWTIPSLTLDLSSLLDQEKLYSEYLHICEFLEIKSTLTRNKLGELHRYWRGLHVF